MTRLKDSYRPGELNQLLADAAAPTSDDVSVAVAGRRLDSAEAVVAFFDELRRERDDVNADERG